MAANFLEYSLALWDIRKNTDIRGDDTGTAIVCTVDTATRATIFTDGRGVASVTNAELTFTDGRITFYIDSATTSVDIMVMTAAGQALFLKAVTQSDSKILVNPDQRSQVLIIPFNGEAADGVKYETPFIMPVGSVVKDVYLNVLNATGSETMDVGLTTADPNGFLAIALLSAVGIVTGRGTVNGGSTIDFIDAITKGALLAPSRIQGTDVVAVNGAIVNEYYLVSTAQAVSYEQTNSITADGYIIIEFTLLPNNG